MKIRLSSRRWLLPLFIGFWTLYFAIFWFRAITVDELGNVIAGHVNIWGDWAAHFTIGSQLAAQSLIPDTSPFLIHHTLSYPFLNDAISAMLVRLGTPFFSAFVIPSFVLSLITVIALYWFYQTLLGSDKLAVIASSIFLFNGGMGFVKFFSDIFTSVNPWVTALNPPHEYTNMEALGYRWISVIDSMIIPQRSFILGFPIALVALTLIYRHSRKQSSLVATTILPILLLSILPLAHTHSFLATMIILSFWGAGEIITNRDNVSVWRYWITLATGTVLLTTPLILTFFWHQITGNSFIQWLPGWYARSLENMGWLEFWIKNWGVTPALASIGWWLHSRTSRTDLWHGIYTFLPFFVLFALLNLLLFQPFIWDNTKLLVWVAVGFSGLAAYALRAIWNWWKPAALILFIFATLSGGIDAYRILRTDLHSYQMYSAEEMEAASWVIHETPSDSIWLTGDSHNHWLYNLTGRQSVLTYRGWLWTHGYDYYQIEADVSQMYQHPLNSSSLFAKYQIDYIVLGSNELNVWHANAPELQSLPLIYQSAHYQVYAAPDATDTSFANSEPARLAVPTSTPSHISK